MLAQSTMDAGRFARVVAALVERTGILTVHNTICSSTSTRRDAAAGLAARVDAMFIVGGRKSSNTGQLYRIAKRISGERFSSRTPARLSPACSAEPRKSQSREEPRPLPGPFKKLWRKSEVLPNTEITKILGRRVSNVRCNQTRRKHREDVLGRTMRTSWIATSSAPRRSPRASWSREKSSRKPRPTFSWTWASNRGGDPLEEFREQELAELMPGLRG